MAFDKDLFSHSSSRCLRKHLTCLSPPTPMEKRHPWGRGQRGGVGGLVNLEVIERFLSLTFLEGAGEFQD